MKFDAYLRKHVMPIDTIDSRGTTYSRTITSATTTSVTFNSAISGQTVTWIGGLIIFTSGTFAGLACTIVSENKSGNDLLGVGMGEPLTSAPVTGTTFILFRNNTNGVQFEDKTYQIGKHISDISWSTDIDKGYDSCTIQLEKFTSIINIYSELVGMNIVIEDEKGHRCFDGLIVDCSFNANGGSISCVGYFSTFAWYHYNKAYNSDATNTSTKMLREICASNPYMSKYLYAIDRGNLWDTAQQSINGIGPINFGESEINQEEAIKRILELGEYGNSLNAVKLLIYNYCIPRTMVIPKTPTTYDYVIGRKNYAFDHTGFNMKSSVGDTASLVYSTYQDTDNVSWQTPYAVNLPILLKFGARRKSISSSSQNGIAEASAIVRVANNDFDDLIIADSYNLSGYVSKNGTNLQVPVYYIKAGDIVKIETSYGYETVWRNQIMNSVSFVVGHTDYSASSGILQLTSISNPKMSEIFAARLKT